MAEDDLGEQMRSLAVQHLLTWTVTALFRQSEDPAAMAARWLAQAERSGDLMAFPGMDPARGDLAAQIFRDEMVRIIKRAQALATGTPFDPQGWTARQD